MTLTPILLPIITALLGIITAILGLGVRIFYNVLTSILHEVKDHGTDIASLQTYRDEHKSEVLTQRAQWRDEADRVWAELRQRRPNGGS